MSKLETRDIVINKFPLEKILINGLTDSELQEIIAKMEEDMEVESDRRNLRSNVHLFGYVALNYAMRLYQVEHLEKARQKAEEKRLDETIKKLEDFLKKP